MVEIPLMHGLVAVVDDEDAGQAAFHWRAHKEHGTWYAIREKRGPDGAKRQVRLHREILCAPSRLFVDHRDGNGLNNQRSNLRLADNSKNLGNMRKPRRNSSGYKGARWNSCHRRWEAQIKVAGQSKWLGYFDTGEEAAKAYDAAAREFFGEFAALNYPAPGQRAA
jgi:hypothetical protein